MTRRGCMSWLRAAAKGSSMPLSYCYYVEVYNELNHVPKLVVACVYMFLYVTLYWQRKSTPEPFPLTVDVVPPKLANKINTILIECIGRGGAQKKQKTTSLH